MTEEPQIIELDDPEGAPRTLAIILLVCGLLGVGFMVVNTVFTGDDQYYIESQWDAGDEPVNNRFDIMPNLVRGRQVGDESDEDEDAKRTEVLKRERDLQTKKKSPTSGPTNPFISPSLTPSPSPSATPGGTKSGTGAATPAPPNGTTPPK
jgi:hypothetical protein